MEEVKAGPRELQCPKCGSHNFKAIPLRPQPLVKLVGSEKIASQLQCLSCGEVVSL